MYLSFKGSYHSGTREILKVSCLTTLLGRQTIICHMDDMSTYPTRETQLLGIISHMI